MCAIKKKMRQNFIDFPARKGDILIGKSLLVWLAHCSFIWQTTICLLVLLWGWCHAGWGCMFAFDIRFCPCFIVDLVHGASNLLLTNRYHILNGKSLKLWITSFILSLLWNHQKQPSLVGRNYLESKHNLFKLCPIYLNFFSCFNG